MEATPRSLIHSIAENYRLCQADFPSNLKSVHLAAPAGEQETIFAGLYALQAVIRAIYDYFSQSNPTDSHWSDREYCYHAIEGPAKLLWAVGVAGQLIQGSSGLELQVNKVDFDQALKRCGGKPQKEAFEVLQAIGIGTVFLGEDGLPYPGGYKKCATFLLGYPPNNEPFLRALTYFAHRLPKNKNTQKGFIFEVFLRADFRPLLPDYRFHIPHLPAEEAEVTRTFNAATLEVWNAISGFMARCHPEYKLFFRVPGPRNRRWVADYSTKDNDYGLWSVFTDEKGLSVRIVFDNFTLPYLLDHVNQLSPGFQETYLNTVACKDCVRCGKHVFFAHQDHMHRLCKSPWYASPYLHLEDLPDIERLIDFRLAPVS